MPIPKASGSVVESSLPRLSSLTEAQKSELLASLLADLEATLRTSGKEAMISLKLGFKSGYQASYKAGKTASWLNINRATLLECFECWLKGEFDNA